MTGYDPHFETPSGKPRRRAFGIPFEGKPGRFNAITDVAGVTVGYTTLISGDGPLVWARVRFAPASPRSCRSPAPTSPRRSLPASSA